MGKRVETVTGWEGRKSYCSEFNLAKQTPVRSTVRIEK
jgi:hypothetical protein